MGPKNHVFSRSTMNCLLSNARSLKSLHKSNGSLVCNISRFQELVYTEEADIALVTETWLHKDILDCEVLPADYSIIRKDRDSRDGGVLLAIKTSSFSSVRQIDIQTDIEICFAELTTWSNLKLLACCCYRPPNSGNTWLDSFNSLLSQVCERYQNILICGDFNYPSISWESPEKTKGAEDLRFTETLADYFLTQLVTSHTRGNNLLDLVITNVPDLVQTVSTLQPATAGLFTDHCTITFGVKASVKARNRHKRTVFDYHREDFDGLRHSLQTLNLCSLIQDDGNVNKDWLRWKNAFLSAVTDHIPTKKLKEKNCPPWITGNIIHTLRKKEAARLKLKNSPTSHQKKTYRDLRAKTKQMIRESRAKYFDTLDSALALQPKRFWSIFKLTNKRASFPKEMSSETVDQDSQHLPASTPRQIAELFNTYFISVFTNSSQNLRQLTSPPITGPLMEDLEIPTDVILSSLKQLDVNKASGPDGIPARLVKATAEQIAPSLSRLFNKSLQQGIIPEDWKLANVVPVFKKGKKELVENYRPISLLPILSKVLERCVLAGLKDHLYHLINRVQHGFTPGRSCVTQLTTVLDYIGSQLDNGKQTDIIYLDMSKAFDKVDHALLLNKLRHFNISGSLHEWFRSYLTGRTQRTTILGFTSHELPVTSGVPQGSILGPLLFLLFVNDLPDVTNSSSIACYADDTKIYKRIDCITDSAALQTDLTNLVQWSESSGLLFNRSKCKCMRITRKQNPVQSTYSIGGADLERCDSERDLGISISSDLTWSKHVIEQCAKANKLLGFVYRSSRDIKNIRPRRTLYLAIVRPHLGYATRVWSPQSVGLIKQVERVQRRATKYVLKLPFRCDMEYKDRLQETNLLPISYWHEMLDIIFFFKVINGLVQIENEVLPVVRDTGITTRASSNGGAVMFTQRRCRTATYQRSFFVRACRTWNALPEHLRVKNLSLTAYKKSLLEYYHHALHLVYDQDDPRTWKSICPKCNAARGLQSTPSCCY